ncbi:MAG: hypothetical protein BWK80_63085 [Desulfobacteraceae bacterium IS3]|nr:MAG: hypothetical protein BWK80_63085 [Desulfobacteraceae bacterium IS3]
MERERHVILKANWYKNQGNPIPGTDSWNILKSEKFSFIPLSEQFFIADSLIYQVDIRLFVCYLY